MLEIIRYTEDWRDKWEQFVPKSINGNFLHTRNFFDHNPANKLDDCSFLFLKKNKVAALLPACFIENDGIKIIHSHLRSTYGGFVVGKEIGTAEAVEIVHLLIGQANSLSINQIIIRNPFRILQKLLSDETDYAMWYHGFVLKSRELEIAIDLTGGIQEIESRFENGTKYNIKKAEKLVQVRITNDFEMFWNILERNLGEKHGKSPVHSLEDMLRLRLLVGEQNVLLFGGYVEGNLISGTVVFVFGDRVLHAQYIGSDSNYQDLRPINAITNFIIRWGHQNKFHYYNLGSANENGGKVINKGLFHFKEGFGGRGTLRETMLLNIK